MSRTGAIDLGRSVRGCRSACGIFRALAAVWLGFVGVTLGADGKERPPVHFEPDCGVVPANHLKFYLHFARPMARGDVFRHLRLIEMDAKGKEVAEVPDPFRDVELWDERFKRLTLWFHPGRQKPGVNLNVEIGPILVPGKRYALEVSPAWLTESGEPLAGALIRHAFSAIAPDETQPDPAAWDIEVLPAARRSEKGLLSIRCRELLDPQSVWRSIRLATVSGKVIDETVPIPFTYQIPDPPGVATGVRLVIIGDSLSPGRHRLLIDPKLEDLAGNSIARPFNLDLDKNPAFKERREPVSIEFDVP